MVTTTIEVRGNMGSRSFRVGTISVTTWEVTADIDVGMKTVEHLSLTLTATTATASTHQAPIVNETFPIAGSAITVLFPEGLVNDTPRTYTFFAIGYS